MNLAQRLAELLGYPEDMVKDCAREFVKNSLDRDIGDMVRMNEVAYLVTANFQKQQATKSGIIHSVTATDAVPFSDQGG